MCELLGFSGRRKRKLNRELTEFFTHAPENPNGWGLALFDGQNRMMKKEEIRADKSRTLAGLLRTPLCAPTAIAHIRLATIGNDEYVNTHPFVGTDASGRTWTLAHNGTIFESGALGPYVYRQEGSTDSERILLYLIDRMNQGIGKCGRALERTERFEILESIIERNTPYNKVNLLIYDGELLYVHTNYRDSLYYREEDDGIFFSTRPLSEGVWINVPFTTLLAYHGGTLVCEGANHGNEYIPDEKSVQALFLAYSGL